MAAWDYAFFIVDQVLRTHPARTEWSVKPTCLKANLANVQHHDHYTLHT